MLHRPSVRTVRLALLTVFFGVLTVRAAGDFEVRFTETAGDDGPIAYSRYYATPEAWTDDIFSTFADVNIWSTVQNLIPALAFKHWHISPEAQAIVLTLIQNVLIGFALSRLAFALTKDEVCAIVAPLLAFAANSTVWNLAWYDGIRLMPYAGQLVLPFLVLAATERVRGRRTSEFLWLLIAAAVHPTLTLYVAAMHATFVLLDGGPRSAGALLPRLLPYGVVVAAAILPRLLLARPEMDGQVSKDELLSLLLSNAHLMLIYDYSPEWSTQGIYGFASFAWLGFIALREAPRLSSTAVRYWVAASAATLSLVLFHLAAMHLRIPAAMQLIGSRATIPWVLISLPFAAYYLVRQILAGRPTASLGALATLIGIGLHHEIAYGAPLIAMWLQDLGDGRVGAWTVRVAPRAGGLVRRLGDLLLGLWAIGFVFKSSRLAWFGGDWMMGPRSSTTMALFFSAAIVVLMVRVMRRTDKPFAFLSGLLPRIPLKYSSLTLQLPACALVVVAAGLAWRFADECAANVAPGTMFYDLRDAETWARNNTDPQASFIVCDHPWRTVSQRQAVYPMMSGMFVYSNSLAILQHNRKLLAHHGLTAPITEPMDWIRNWSRQREEYLGYDEHEVATFAREFKADYVVRKSADRRLDLPEVFRNSNFVIYEVPAGLASAAPAKALR